MTLDKIVNELISQAPYLAAIIIVVGYFIRTMENQRATFHAAMAERDRLFDESLKRRDEVFQETIKSLTKALNGVENTMIKLDTDARNRMNIRTQPKRQKKARS